jgi:acetolactate decarboxylase
MILVTYMASTAGAGENPPDMPTIQTWGTMREVLRDGKSEERITLAAQLSEHTIAVGALAGLAGEITILNGVVHVATFDKGELNSVPSENGARATLLVMAEVPAWREQILPVLADFSSVEQAVRTAALETGIDVTQPFPFVIEGLAADVSLHVIAGACPIATPDGPEPGRFKDQDRTVTLVGFYAENQAGRLTHHNRSSHVHVIVAEANISGHLEEASFTAGARLRLPE